VRTLAEELAIERVRAEEAEERGAGQDGEEAPALRPDEGTA